MSDIAHHVLSLLSLSGSEANPSPLSDSHPVQVPAETTNVAQSDLPSPPSELATLRARVAQVLTVFDNPRCAHLDVPDWVHRAAPLAHHHRPTVRGLVRAMREAAAELGLADGERYVLDTVCACADDAGSFKLQEAAAHALETQGEAEGPVIACRLQHLASAWVAFLLWPFYARMQDPESWARGHASPCTGLSHAPKAMALGDFDPDECLLRSSYPLRDQVLRRDGHQCVVSGLWDNWSRKRAPPGTTPGYVDAVRIFKHPLVVYKDVYDNDKAKRESVLLSLEVLRRYCQLDSRYIDIEPPGSAGLMDDPANLLSLCCNSHIKFDAFGICLVPTQCANTYKVKDHDPQFAGLPLAPRSMTLPRTVTFQDLSSAADEPVGVRLPSRELLRMHAALGSVLYTTGAASMFDRIEEVLDRERPDVGDLPVPDPDGASFWKDVVDAGADPSPGLSDLARMLGVTSPTV